MPPGPQPKEVLALLRGLRIYLNAVCREQEDLYRLIWANSSIREILEKNVNEGSEFINEFGKNPTQQLQKLQHLLRETQERGCVVAEGIRQLAAVKAQNQYTAKMSQMPFARSAAITMPDGTAGARVAKDGKATGGLHADAANLDISSITLKEFENILSQRNKDSEVSLRTPTTESKQVQDKKDTGKAQTTGKSAYKGPSKQTLDEDSTYVENVLKMMTGVSNTIDAAASAAPIDLPTLSKVAKQRKVPSSRIGRMASFGGLFAGLGIGTINELTKGALGLGGSTNMKEALLSPANAERIVDTLCKVRGAALKIGQILSIQDSNVVSPQLAKAFDRVRQAADYMPDWQVERVMTTQLGPEWRALLTSFDDKPFAAASIGQVHRATVKSSGMQVAVKIQYPGVAQSIESDIDNLIGMLKVWDVFPQGFFIDNVVKVAKRELTWEVDYKREAEYTEKFKAMIAPYPEYYVPAVVRELTTANVLTTELVPGVPLDKCFNLSDEERHHIGASVLKLCLRELFELQCMQTDPNWSNFLYDAETRRLMLIDFGSTRFYDRNFIKKYREVIICAANDDRKGVLDISHEMGFLTGFETRQMKEAHVDAVMILGEIFRYDGNFDFGRQKTTERISHLVPTMVAHRLCPPPEEIYSIHRKLSGIFLLCARLNVKLNCRPFYDEIIVGKYKE